jgi:AcrR family transcriptional regulator
MEETKTGSTKERILDAAERLFAEKGFAQTSLRDITTEAGVNLAAVNYHFHSKDALITAMFERRVGPVNVERMKLLDQFEREAGGAPVPAEKLLYAVIHPVFGLMESPEGASAALLIGRVYVEPGNMFKNLFSHQFAPVVERFIAAARRTAPDLSEEELFWKMFFVVAVMAHTVAGLRHLSVISGGLCDSTDTENVVDRLISFAVGGFRATARPAWKEGGPECNGSH